MGLNKKFVKMKNDKRAEMGVGTMIIFIAMVLVAAVAASVLISTANQVRTQAASTGSQAINNVATGFVIQDVVGTVNTATQKVTTIDVYMRLQAGSPNVNLDNVLISETDAHGSCYLNANGTTATTTTDASFTYVKTINVQNFTANVMGQGDMVKMTITDVHGGVAMGIGLNEHVTIKIIPAYGQANLIEFTTPEQYSSSVITLR